MSSGVEKIAKPAGIPHLRALDGLRGLALLGVLFFHSNAVLPGGYLGVDLFFVLSGFLITSLLVAEHRANGRIALSAFWIRRARRLFPALLLLMPVIALYARLVAKPDELHSLRADALATLAYVANWRSIFSHKSYWELFASPSPLEHTWSLSIEEQFYLLWPLLVVAILSIGRRASHLLLGVTAALAALSMALMLVLYTPENVSRVYLGTDTRAAGILAGALLAMLVSPSANFSPRVVRALDIAGAIALVGLGVAWCTLQGKSWFLYHGGFWLTEIGALVLIVCAISGARSRVARLLSIRPLTWVGSISYGVYLWHWPVNVVLTAERFDIGIWLHVLRFALTFAIALASFHLVETPIRKHGVPFGRPLFIVPAAVAAAVLLLVRATYARELPLADATAAADAARVASSMRGASPAPAAPDDEPVTLRVMLLGDSTGNSLGWTIRGLRQRGVAVDLYGHDGCTLMEDNCYGDTWVSHAAETHTDVALLNLGGAFEHGLVIKGRYLEACHHDWNAHFEKTMSTRVSALAETSTHVAISTIPYPLGPYDTPQFRSETDCINRSIRRVAHAIPNVEIYDLAEHLCPKGACTRKIGDDVVRPDGVHYSMEGGAEPARWILDQMQATVAMAAASASRANVVIP